MPIACGKMVDLAVARGFDSGKLKRPFKRAEKKRTCACSQYAFVLCERHLLPFALHVTRQEDIRIANVLPQRPVATVFT